MSIALSKIAIFLPDLVVGGAERSMLKLAEGIVQRGYLVDLVLARAQGPLLGEVPETVRLVDLGAKRVLTSLPALIQYLRNEKPLTLLSVLHTNLIALWAWRLSGVHSRIVVSERNTLTTESKHFASDLRMRLMPILARHFYPWAKCIVAVSKGVAIDLERVTNLPADRIKVIYNPIVTPAFKAMAQAPAEHPWYKQSELPIILSVGRLSVQKGFDILIRAFNRVRQIIPSRLIIVGDGEERVTLEMLVDQLELSELVDFPGIILNPYPYMVKSNVFVLSSRWEGLPGVLIEALYCGAPLVSTDCPSGAREILADGKYGRLVPVDDIDAMAQAIVAALKGEISRPPANSWQPFGLDTVVDQYVEVLGI